MQAADRSKRLTEYYAELANNRAKQRDADFSAAADSWLAGVINSQPRNTYSYFVVRFTNCEFVAEITEVSPEVVDVVSRMFSDLGYRVSTVVRNHLTYMCAYDADSLAQVRTEYPNYTLFDNRE